MWVVLSDLRFQADAALLLIVMVILNAIAAMLLVPSWVLVFKPSFIYANSGSAGATSNDNTVQRDVGPLPVMSASN